MWAKVILCQKILWGKERKIVRLFGLSKCKFSLVAGWTRNVARMRAAFSFRVVALRDIQKKNTAKGTSQGCNSKLRNIAWWLPAGGVPRDKSWPTGKYSMVNIRDFFNTALIKFIPGLIFIKRGWTCFYVSLIHTFHRPWSRDQRKPPEIRQAALILPQTLSVWKCLFEK